jgi:hypothetical protein
VPLDGGFCVSPDADVILACYAGCSCKKVMRGLRVGLLLRDRLVCERELWDHRLRAGLPLRRLDKERLYLPVSLLGGAR